MVSLDTIWSRLKGTGAASLDELVQDGYTRTLAGDGLARVSPFRVEGGTAPDPDTETAPYSLDDWENYVHNSFFPLLGLDLQVTELAWNKIVISWTRPAGYTRDLANVNQRVYWKDMGTSEDTNVNPFDGGFSASVGDVTSYEITTNIGSGHYYAIGVKQEWDDSDEILMPSDDQAYGGAIGETLLLGAGAGISSGEVPEEPPPPGINIVQNTDPETCSGGCFDCVSVTCHYDEPTEGLGPMTLQRKIDAGSWTTVVTNITSAGSYPGTYNGFDTVHFRIYYDSDPGDIIDEDTLAIECNQV